MDTNKELVSEALKDVRDQVVIATKCMFQRVGDDTSRKRLLNPPEEVVEPIRYGLCGVVLPAPGEQRHSG